MFGIDTINISCSLNQYVWTRVRRFLIRKGGARWQYQYAKEGIHRISFPCHEEFGYYALQLQLSPATLLGRMAFSITPAEVVKEQLPEVLTKWLVQHTGIHNWPDVLQWSANRVDFACDVQSLSQDEVDAYIALARSGSVPPSYKVLHRPAWKGTAAYRNQSERVQFYDKGRQMLKRHSDADPAVLAAYQGTMRIEVQIKKDRLAFIQKKAGWQFRTLDHFLQPGLAEAIVRQRASEVVGTGAYISAGRAKQVLAANLTNGTLTKARYCKLAGFLDYIQEQGSLHQSRACCKEGNGLISLATFDAHVRQLTQLSIPLPLIPRRGPVNKLRALLPDALPGVAVNLNDWLAQLSNGRAFVLSPQAAAVSIDLVKPTIQLRSAVYPAMKATVPDVITTTAPLNAEVSVNERSADNDQNHKAAVHGCCWWELQIIHKPRSWVQYVIVQAPQQPVSKQRSLRHVLIRSRPGKTSGWILRGPPN